MTRPVTPTALKLARRFEAVRFMDGAQFEVFVADLFGAMGHRTVLCGGVGDQGVRDRREPSGRAHIAVQCKNYTKPVGNRPVQEVHAGARHHRCVEVAPAGHTGGASDLAKSTGVSLYDADTIHQWIRKVDKIEKERAGKTLPGTRHPGPANTAINSEPEEARTRAVWHPHPDDPPEPQGSSHA